MKVPLQPCDRFAGTRDDMAGRLVRPGDHDHRQAECPSRLDLGVGRPAAGILGHEDLDLFTCQQTLLGGAVERPARLKESQIGRQTGWIGHLDHTREIAMLGCGGKGVQLLTAEAEKDATRRRSERESRCRHRRDDLPTIARLRAPGRAHERGERHAGAGAGEDSVGGHLIGVGMRRVDDRVDSLLAEKADETIDAAKAADSCRDRLRPGRGRPTGERENRLEARVTGKLPGEGRRLCRTAEDENAKSRGHDR